MARSFHPDLDLKRGELVEAWPEELIANPEKRGRKYPPSPEAVRAKMKSIQERTQITPIKVEGTADKKLEVVAGWTRWEAISLHNRENPDNRMRIKCIVADIPKEKDERKRKLDTFLTTIAENKEREITTVIDDAHNIRRLEMEFALTDEEILLLYSDKIDPKTGEKIPQYPQWLENIRKLLKLSPAEQKAIHEGQLSASAGHVLADLGEVSEETRKEIVAEARKEKKSGKVTAANLKKIAAKKGLVKEQGPLTSNQMTAAIEYLRDENPDKKELTKFCNAFVKWRARELPEPDFFRTMKRLFKDS